MSEEHNLNRIQAPALNDQYGVNIQHTFDRIDDNFGILANKKLMQGDPGESLLSANVPFSELLGSGDTFSQEVNGETYIFLRQREEIKSAFTELRRYITNTTPSTPVEVAEEESDVTFALNILGNAENNYSVLINFNKPNSPETPIVIKTTIPVVFIDQRFWYNNVTSPGTVDLSNVISYEIVDGAGKWKCVQSFPSLCYRNDLQDESANTNLYWVLNGTKTNIPAQGPKGKDGSDGTIYLGLTDDAAENWPQEAIDTHDLNITKIFMYTGGDVGEWVDAPIFIASQYDGEADSAQGSPIIVMPEKEAAISSESIEDDKYMYTYFVSTINIDRTSETPKLLAQVGINNAIYARMNEYTFKSVMLNKMFVNNLTAEATGSNLMHGYTISDGDAEENPYRGYLIHGDYNDGSRTFGIDRVDDVQYGPNNGTSSNLRPNDAYLFRVGGVVSVQEGSSNTASGTASHAEGASTTASGDYSHTEGYNNTASESASHAEGASTTASGDYSHTEGSSNTASGSASHAEGSNTLASGSASHAEGSNTLASGTASHAEGASTTASGDYSHTEGYNNTASGSASHAEGSNTLASGSASHAEGASTTASGDYSHTEGYNNTASGTASHAEGASTTASGDYSHASGYQTEASGNYSHTEGSSSKASGTASHAEGASTTASGDYSHAEGLYNRVSDVSNTGSGAHVEGIGIIASGEASHAEGKGNEELISDFTLSSTNNPNVYVVLPTNIDPAHKISIGDLVKVNNNCAQVLLIALVGANENYNGTHREITLDTTIGTINEGVVYVLTGKASGLAAHIEGLGGVAIGTASHAEGASATASGDYSHAEGSNSKASGSASHAEGFNTIARGDYSHAEGLNTNTHGLWPYGSASHAEGFNTAAHGDYSHAEGNGSWAVGSASHAENSGISYGDYSHAEGLGTASGDYSHAEGNSYAQGVGSHAEGIYDYGQVGNIPNHDTWSFITYTGSGSGRTGVYDQYPTGDNTNPGRNPMHGERGYDQNYDPDYVSDVYYNEYYYLESWHDSNDNIDYISVQMPAELYDSDTSLIYPGGTLYLNSKIKDFTITRVKYYEKGPTTTGDVPTGEKFFFENTYYNNPDPRIPSSVTPEYVLTDIAGKGNGEYRIIGFVTGGTVSVDPLYGGSGTKKIIKVKTNIPWGFLSGNSSANITKVTYQGVDYDDHPATDGYYDPGCINKHCFSIKTEDSGALGRYSHVEGNSCFAKGDYSHAQGIFTETVNPGEVACGFLNESGHIVSDEQHNGYDVFKVATNPGDQDTRIMFSIGAGEGPDNYSWYNLSEADGLCRRRNALMVDGAGNIYKYYGNSGTSGNRGWAWYVRI